MINNDFRNQYSTIPVAVFSRDYKANTQLSNFGPLSHNHKEFEVLYVLDGEAVCYIDSIEYKIKKGDMIIIAPYLIHRLLIIAASDFVHRCMCFDLDVIHDKALCESLEAGIILPMPFISRKESFSETLGNYIVKAHSAATEKAHGWELSVIGNLSLFFSCLLEHGLFERKRNTSKHNDFCCKVMNYIDENYTRSITSADAAASLFMNNSYFCRKFKDSFGFCFQKYLEMYRIEKAKLLLISTDMSVSDISVSTGFASFSYFSKTFKTYFSRTPTQYRGDFTY